MRPGELALAARVLCAAVVGWVRVQFDKATSKGRRS